MKQGRRIFLVAPSWRAWLEAWALGAIGLVVLLSNHARLLDVVLGQAIFFLMIVVTFWHALRLHLAPNKKIATIALHEFAALASLSPLGIILWSLLLRVLGLHPVLTAINYAMTSWFLIGLTIVPFFVASRLALYVWDVWSLLRRRRLVWTLTNIQLQLVLALGIVSALLASILVVLSARQPLLDLDTWVRTILPFAAIAGVIGVVAVLGILPLAALIAWLTARRTTRRLEALTQAAAVVRDGDTSVRLEVDGEDEVAQLQEDFNAMAAALDAAMTALQTERDRVTALLEARRQLIAGVSHELRTPLATLRGYLESLKREVGLSSSEAGGSDLDTVPVGEAEKPPTEAAFTETGASRYPALRHDLDVMDRELIRLQTLIDDLFTLSRAEVNGLSLDLQCVDLRAIVTRRVDAIAPLAWQRDRVQVLVEPSEDLPSASTRVVVDAGRVEQILVNLLRNALRHTPPGGIVVVSLDATGPDDVALRVCDTGTGIAPEDLPHIWERFYRGAEARDRDAHGAGLGLSLVKELTEAMEGRVGVQNMPGEGTCFHVCFPRCT